MDILYLLIPMSTLLVLAILAVFAWALHGGQFDDLEREGARIFGPGHAAFDADQAAPTGAAEESTPAPPHPHRPPPPGTEPNERTP